ncbi:tRNA (adenosine(37)-N6)-dimethylallyltransferase MiaA [Protaetiibacter mangrovi]|uniref:tRNA dimethylallyltransferase n=1 Tax=Protaetiibacter mangrovi TaxID=2970926 RepID=A0ABT1ZF40_9MICO|nr:tRNA (adenosine(37)-N6)-dimethylallyltransferase MiaA [Protaetiibacter mangrovi]MCS0499323.1 tRNA (adenosine(37)-N6)-dimethylallyltransferase MiaA [Protaetiibacter mangrovi]TPX02310.1 tRNA (adenosine(37)-N6)-dimethylallyltransferase MiaA [Schumannella luteola]
MNPLVAVVGATGTGKSALSLDLAELLAADGTPAEIVNADAMQLYRGMDIGTAKLPMVERRGIPHHLVDVLEPREEASVARYQPEAREIVDDILRRGAVPILVGGSGLYVSSVLYDFRFPGTDAGIRERLEAELDAAGPGALFDRLRAQDPAAAAAIGPHNGRRIVRALEVIELTGEPFGAGLDAESRPWRPSAVIGLRLPREELVQRLDARVLGMWSAGLVDEVARLRPSGFGATAARAIGYAQALAQLDGELDESAAIAETQALTRRYARRQVSWFGRSRDTAWVDADDPARVRTALSTVRAAAARLPR